MAAVEQIVTPSTRLEALRSALDAGSMRPAKRMINALHPAEVASLIESLRPAERQILWELVPADNEGDILLGLNDEVRASIIATMDDEEIVRSTIVEMIDKLNDILVVWNLGVDNSKIIESPKPKEKIIVFNHRAAAYKGYPTFIRLMEEYRIKRNDFKVWVPQLDGKPEHSWIDNTKVAKHDYYTKLQSCTVGVQMRQTNYGWSVAATDCMMNGTPMIYQESDCYREIEPNGLFFKFKKFLIIIFNLIIWKPLFW